MIIQSGFFQYIYHVGCAFNLHSFINSGLILGGQSSSKRQTVFFLLVDPVDKSHKDPDVIDLSVPRRAQYLHKAWKRHQDAVYWVDINLAITKGLTFYQTRSNAINLQETVPAYCIPNVVKMETGEVLDEKVYMSPRLPPKISLNHEWKRELGSEHAQRSEVGQLSRSFQSNQPILNPIRERSGRPVIRDDARTVQDERKTSRSQEIDVSSFHEELVSSERTGRAVIETSVIQARSSEDSNDPNVEKTHERTRRLVTDLTVPRRAQYLRNAWKRHQDAVYWVDINLAIREGLTFYQTRSNAIILQEIFPAYSIPKVVRLKTGEVFYAKTYMSPRPPPKISLRHDWTRNWVRKFLDNEKEKLLDNQKEKLLDKQKFFQPTPNPIRARSGRPDKMRNERKTSRSQEISVNSFYEEPPSSDRTGRLVETEEIQALSSEDSKSLNVEQIHDRTGRHVNDTVAVQDDPQVYHEAGTLNIDDETLRERIEADMDLKIPGLPHSVVKHAQSTSVRELIQKIENPPDRHALQQDLRQNQAKKQFSPEAKNDSGRG